MMKNYLLIVEGSHDIAFLTKVLSTMGYKEIKSIKHLPPLMAKKLIPKSFPFIKDKLNIFNIIPWFCKKGDSTIAIINGNGETHILNKLDDILSEFDITEIKQVNKILIFADGDLKNRNEKINSILDIDFVKKDFEFLDKKDLSKENPCINIKNRFNIPVDYFIFPDNNLKGRLEDVILELINLNDKDLLNDVTKFIENLDSEYKVEWSQDNSKEEKSKIGIIGNVLIPGCSNVTLLHNKEIKWISEENRIKVKSLDQLYLFLNKNLQ
ncbi:Uncharacterised protein [[Clostridium] sordellii]|uniref:DUF3226 domain-containing protein n=1 Tax=Paraclostridium sordellii TaxID=1505 RepID=UPI0005E16B29|nr:DUF3226 domain-containing protein [Paeniclostridium sordellii]CEQ14293.1 Uncharacterised protein [[Clostridium] sordellii] [Paeniclostridium sordellii]